MGGEIDLFTGFHRVMNVTVVTLFGGGQRADLHHTRLGGGRCLSSAHGLTVVLATFVQSPFSSPASQMRSLYSRTSGWPATSSALSGQDVPVPWMSPLPPVRDRISAAKSDRESVRARAWGGGRGRTRRGDLRRGRGPCWHRRPRWRGRCLSHAGRG